MEDRAELRVDPQDETVKKLAELEEHYEVLNRMAGVLNELVIVFRRANKVLQKDVSETARVGTSLNKWATSLQQQDTLVSTWLNKLGQVTAFVEKRKARMSFTLTQFVNSLQQACDEILETRALHEGLKPLKQKLAHANQRIDKIRFMRGPVNMPKLLEAEGSRDSINGELQALGDQLIAQYRESSEKARQTALKFIWILIQNYKHFFQTGHKQLEVWLQEDIFVHLASYLNHPPKFDLRNSTSGSDAGINNSNTPKKSNDESSLVISNPASSDNEILHHVPEEGLKPDLCGYPNMLEAELPEQLDVYDDDGSLSDTSMDSPDSSPRDMYAEAYPTTQEQNAVNLPPIGSSHRLIKHLIGKRRSSTLPITAPTSPSQNSDNPTPNHSLALPSRLRTGEEESVRSRTQRSHPNLIGLRASPPSQPSSRIPSESAVINTVDSPGRGTPSTTPQLFVELVDEPTLSTSPNGQPNESLSSSLADAPEYSSLSNDVPRMGPIPSLELNMAGLSCPSNFSPIQIRSPRWRVSADAPTNSPIEQNTETCTSDGISSITDTSVRNSSFEFSVEKVVRRRTKRKVVLVDLSARTIGYCFPDKRKPPSVRSNSELLQVARSRINDKKLKLTWKGKDKQERLIFPSKEQRERFYEAAWAIRKPPGSEDSEQLLLFMGTWNMGNSPPPKSLSPWLQPDTKYDIIVISTQEVNTETDWFRIVQAWLGEEYVTIATQSLVIMRLIVLARRIHYYKISGIVTGTEATGIGNVIGNKGALGIAFQFNETSLCFVGSHLAARDERVHARNADYAAIVNGLHLTKNSFDITNNFHAVFWIGDLNYRIAMKREKVLQVIAEKNWKELCLHDQFLMERRHGRCFAGFNEALIQFPPTYRYNRGDRTYSEEKMRVPSYCDRILWKTAPGFNVKCHEYNCCDVITTSDHSPVYGVFSIVVQHPDTTVVTTQAAMGQSIADMQGLGLDIILTRLTLHLDNRPTASVAVLPYLTFCANCIQGEWQTPACTNTSSPMWDEHQIHTITTNRSWLFIWVSVNSKESASRVAQGVIPLANACGDTHAPFNIKLVEGGLIVGLLSGQVHVPDRITVASLEEEGHAKQGYLTKEGNKRRSWKRRWFVLYKSGTLSYFSTPTARTALKKIALSNCVVTVAEGYLGKKNCFSLESPKRTFFMYADDKEDMEAWIAAISSFIK